MRSMRIRSDDLFPDYSTLLALSAAISTQMRSICIRSDDLFSTYSSLLSLSAANAYHTQFCATCALLWHKTTSEGPRRKMKPQVGVPKEFPRAELPRRKTGAEFPKPPSPSHSLFESAGTDRLGLLSAVIVLTALV